MHVSFEALIIGVGNHASMVIPDEVLTELGTNRRAPLKISINGHTYRSTATGVAGECRVVFPQRDRAAAGVNSGQTVTVQLELETGYREVEVPVELATALSRAGLREKFDSMSYSRRKNLALQVSEAKSEETRARRLAKVIEAIVAT